MSGTGADPRGMHDSGTDSFLGEGGYQASQGSSGYPTNVSVNEPGTINLTVHNREFADVSYEIRIYRATMEAYFNASANRTELRELSRTYVSNLSLQLGNDGFWNRSYTFNFSSLGIYRLYFNLYKLPDSQDVYRYLFLTVRVRI